MRNGIRVVIADYTSVKGEGKGQQTGELKRTFRSYQQIADASFHLRLSGIIPFFDQDRRSDHRSFICEALFYFFEACYDDLYANNSTMLCCY